MSDMSKEEMYGLALAALEARVVPWTYYGHAFCAARYVNKERQWLTDEKDTPIEALAQAAKRLGLAPIALIEKQEGVWIPTAMANRLLSYAEYARPVFVEALGPFIEEDIRTLSGQVPKESGGGERVGQ